jgi:Reverse transcriptase (RNA-dependent DNA polymerase)
VWVASAQLRMLLSASRIWVRLPKRIKRLSRSLFGRKAPPKIRQVRDEAFVALGNVRLNVKLVVEQLRSDLYDDWFPDPLGFGDMLTPERLRKSIDLNVRENGGHYVPSERTLFNIPKPEFTLRYALETALVDRAVYHGLVCHLMPFYDRLISWNAFSHRFDYERKRSAPTFKPGIEAWKHFVGSARSALKPSSYLVAADVSNFFEHIQLPRLKAQMEDLIPSVTSDPLVARDINAHLVSLFEFLDYWSYEKGRGLPQNRDASSFLANLYMREVDSAMISAGYGEIYFRYMDDIRIVCDDEYRARKAIKDMSVFLRFLGLSLNGKKTAIIPATDTGEIDRCLADSSDTLEKIDVLWRRRTRAAIFTLWPLLRDCTLALAAEGQVDTREFRYCIRRFSMLARFKNLHFPQKLYAPITKAICAAITTHPASTDQYAQYLSSVKVDEVDLAPVIEYLSDPSKSIYTWQNYRLWFLFASKNIVSEKLRQAAHVAVRQPDSPARAGASLYLGAISCGDGKRLVSELFPEVESFIGQRMAIIAIHEEPYSDLSEMMRHVRKDLSGVYSTLGRAHRRGVYFEPSRELLIELSVSAEASYE